jgi:hypothetical protein
MEVFIYKLQGNEFRLTPFKLARSKFCDFFEKEVFMLPQFCNDFNIPYECPIKKGNYTGQYTPKANIPRNFDGRYKLIVNYYYLGELRESFEFIAEIHHYTMA